MLRGNSVAIRFDLYKTKRRTCGAIASSDAAIQKGENDLQWPKESPAERENARLPSYGLACPTSPLSSLDLGKSRLVGQQDKLTLLTVE